MRTTVIYPQPDLQSIVSHIMVFEKETFSEVLTPLPCFADGCPGVIFQQTEGEVYLNNKSHRLSSFFLYGQTIKPVVLLPRGSFRIIVFYLFPSSLITVFGLPASEVTETCLDLSLLPNARTRFSLNKLLDAETAEAQIAIIGDYLLQQVKAYGKNGDHVVHYAIDHLMQKNGQTSLRSLQNNLHVTERTFERKFERYVGVSPKLFSRICQFQSSLQQMREGRFVKFSDLAYENGYSDQSHFIRSFKEFTGVSPMEYIRQIQPQQKEAAEE